MYQYCYVAHANGILYFWQSGNVHSNNGFAEENDWVNKYARVTCSTVLSKKILFQVFFFVKVLWDLRVHAHTAELCKWPFFSSFFIYNVRSVKLMCEKCIRKCAVHIIENRLQSTRNKISILYTCYYNFNNLFCTLHFHILLTNDFTYIIVLYYFLFYYRLYNCVWTYYVIMNNLLSIKPGNKFLHLNPLIASI